MTSKPGSLIAVKIDYSQVELRTFARLLQSHKWYWRLWYWLRDLTNRRSWKEIYLSTAASTAPKETAMTAEQEDVTTP